MLRIPNIPSIPSRDSSSGLIAPKAVPPYAPYSIAYNKKAKAKDKGITMYSPPGYKRLFSWH
jgi:hypothetical protein